MGIIVNNLQKTLLRNFDDYYNFVKKEKLDGFENLNYNKRKKGGYDVMVHHAILVNPETDTVVYAESKIFAEDDVFDFTYEATNEAFNLAKKEDVKGGYIYLDDAPTLASAKAIISAELKRVVYKIPIETPEEGAACQLLEQYGIPAIYNPDIIVNRKHGDV